MTDLQAIILGIVQGATEFLPISSTAHLRIVPAIFGWPDPGAAFTAVIQWGTLLAALVYFRLDVIRILFGRTRAPEAESGPEAGRNLLLPILVGTLPIVICGVLFKHHIEGRWRGLDVVGTSMIVFALLLAAAEWRYRATRTLGDVTVRDGLFVGLGQALALIPGASRSGTTITAALFTGLERSTAARFSFLLSLPAIFAAGAKELWDYREWIATAGMTRPLVIATAVSFVVGWASIDWLLKFLRRRPTYGFVIYRILVGIAILSLALSGRIR